MRPAEVALATKIAQAVVWDAICPEDEKITDGFRRFHRNYPWTARALGLVLLYHFYEIGPARYDAVHLLAKAMARGNRWLI